MVELLRIRKMPWVFQASLIIFIFFLFLFPTSSITGANKVAGWAMPTVDKPMIIGVPRDTFSDQFVHVKQSINNPHEKIYSGFCIAVFREVMKTLSPSYYQNYKFVQFNGTNDDLVNSVADGTLDAAVGDITIFDYRWKVVKFTHPFSELGMSLVIPVNLQTSNKWIFLNPFTKEVWLATWAIFMYTMFIVWFMEHRANPEFGGPWQDQLGNILWFTFATLFFAHRERIQYNYTRVVVVLWLFVVLFVVQSYGASFSSILTAVSQLPNIDSLKKSDAMVGCFDNDVIKNYLVNVLHFKVENIRDDFATQSQFVGALKNGAISAAFLQTPYANAVVKQCCDQLMITGPTFEFGGFGFVFNKVSPLVANVSEAIIRLLEDGTISKLEDVYFTTSSDCSNFQTSENNNSLSLRNFSVLYSIYFSISTICLLLFSIHSFSLNWASVRNKTYRLITSVGNKMHQIRWRSLNNSVSRDPDTASASDHVPNHDIEMGRTPNSAV